MEPGPEQLWERENCCHTTIEHCRSVPCPGRNRSRRPIHRLNCLSRNLLPRYSKPFNRGYTPPVLHRALPLCVSCYQPFSHLCPSVFTRRAEVSRRRVCGKTRLKKIYLPNEPIFYMRQHSPYTFELPPRNKAPSMPRIGWETFSANQKQPVHCTES